MRRPEFIKIIIGSALAWPLAAQAEQPGPGKWRIGMLAPEIRQKPIREGLRELGYVEGQNLLIQWRFDDRVDRFAARSRSNWSDSTGRYRRQWNTGGASGPTGHETHPQS
jgi:hypothetical protein